MHLNSPAGWIQKRQTPPLPHPNPIQSFRAPGRTKGNSHRRIFLLSPRHQTIKNKTVPQGKTFHLFSFEWVTCLLRWTKWLNLDCTQARKIDLLQPFGKCVLCSLESSLDFKWRRMHLVRQGTFLLEIGVSWLCNVWYSSLTFVLLQIGFFGLSQDAERFS